MSQLNYKLTAQVVPERPTKQIRHSKYRQIIDEFIESNVESARLEFEGPFKTVWSGLYNTAKKYSQPKIKVIRRGEEIYLQRIN